jgi:hypothetical protein
MNDDSSTRSLSGETHLPDGVTENSVRVNDATINYKIAGRGPS